MRSRTARRERYLNATEHKLLSAIQHFCALVFAMAILVYASPAFSQMDQGAITGVVLDSTSAAIPGAQVILTDIDTGLVLKTKSNASGYYFFAPIKTGRYKVSASASGFATTEQTNIMVHVTDRLDIPLKLKPGKVSETVTVTSAAPLMQTQTSETATVISSKFLNDAPLANRNWMFIAQEAPGSTPMVGRGAGNGDFSSNGQHEEQNNFALDGVDNNTMNSDYINGSSYNLAPPPDAIAEFKVETSNYSAAIGRGHGAVLNATTKSGTNQFHGDLWEYNRNTIFDALVWNQAKGSKAATFHMNQFGATLGGPILHNHLFFFVDVQEQRFVNGASPTTLSVPTARMRQGDFSELLSATNSGGSCPEVLYMPNSNTGAYGCKSNHITTPPSGALQQSGSQVTTDGLTGYTFQPGQNVFSPSQLDPVALNILKLYPCPNYSPAGSANYGKPNGGWSTGDCNTEAAPDTGVTHSNYQTNLTSISDPINWDGKLDWNINSRDLVTFRYDYQHVINTLSAPLGPILDGTGSYAGHNQTYLSENGMFSETHTFSPTLINSFTFGYNWGNDANLQYNYNRPMSALLGMGGVPFAGAPQNGGLPTVGVGGITGFGTHGNDPAHEGENVYQIMDNVTKIDGNHSLKMGFEAMPIRFYSTAAGNPRGAYSFGGSFTGVTGAGGPTGYGVADFLAQGYDQNGNLTGTDNMASGSISTFVYNHYVQQYLAGYIQDDWKVTSTLTLNLGLRYEYFTPKLEQADQWANWVPETGYLNSTGGHGSGLLMMPESQENQKLDPNFLALLAADNVQVAYSPDRHLVKFPKANWSPRLGAAYQINNKTVARIGAGVFFGAFEPGGGSALTQNPPYIMNASLPALPSCTEGTYCGSQYAFGNTLEGGLGGFQAAGGIEHYASFPNVEEVDPVMHTPYTVNYNLSVQRALNNATTVTASYVGSIGRHLVTLMNNPDQPMAVTIGGQQLNGLTPAPHFNGGQWMTWEGGSSYNALQVEAQKHYSNGLSFLATYTWAHAFDNTIDLLGGDYGAYKQSYLIPIKYEWGQSGYDIRDRAVINVDYELPFGIGRQFVNHSGILDKIVGGWRTDMQWWGQTGTPFTVGINRIPGWQNANGGESNSAIKVANPYSSHLTAPNQSNPMTASGMTTAAASNTGANVCAARTRTKQRWFNPCAFADPLGVINTSNQAAVNALAPYATGYFSYYSPAVGADNSLSNGRYNSSGGPSSLGVDVPYVTGYAAARPFFGSPKNDVSGPGNWKLNASLFKDFTTWREHGQYLELRADAFNVLNHPSWGGVGHAGTNIGANSVAITGPMAQQSNTIDSRYFQLSAKYVF